MVPAFDLMAGQRDAPLAIDGPSETDTGALHRMGFHKGTRGLGNLSADSLGAQTGHDIQPDKRRQCRAIALADAKLQLRSADFNAK